MPRSVTSSITRKESYQNKQKSQWLSWKRSEVASSKFFLIHALSWIASHISSSLIPFLLINGSYYTSDMSTIKPIIKCVTKKKFKEKILVSIAIEPKVLKSLIYRKFVCIVMGKQLLNKGFCHRLILCIRSNDNGCNFVFWRDLISNHYQSSKCTGVKSERCSGSWSYGKYHSSSWNF